MGKNTLIEGMYENADVEEVKIFKKRFSKDPIQKWFPKSIIYTHFLEETFEKVDFDLVYTISKIIE